MTQQTDENPDKTSLFLDAKSYYVYKGDLVYYIHIIAGGFFRVDWEFAEEIHQNLRLWQTLMSAGIVKGMYLSKKDAETQCDDSNIAARQNIDKAFMEGLKLNTKK
jgi:hypothetical protein